MSWLRQHIGAFGPLIGLLGVYGFFALVGPASFSTVRNLETIARQTTIVGTAALGMTLVIIAGGIDLSAGSVIALSTVASAGSGPGMWTTSQARVRSRGASTRPRWHLPASASWHMSATP